MKSHALAEKTPVVAPMEHAALLARFNTAKDRQVYERHLVAYEAKAGPEAVQRWKRLACLLMTLAPFPAKQPTRFCNVHAMQFFVPDGKYRMQVFALQGLQDGTLLVYLPDMLPDAIRAGILAKPGRGAPAGTYALAGKQESLLIDQLDGKTPNPDPVYKDMTGWSRKALRVTLPPGASEILMNAVERLCSLASNKWITAAAAE